MKKTMLLTSLIAVAAMAATTGSVEFGTGTVTDVNTLFTPSQDKKKIEIKGTTYTHKLADTFVTTEVKVKETGFSFGGTFKAKDVVVFTNETGQNAPNNDDVIKKFEDTTIWAKYELPEIKGFNSYVKGSWEKIVNAKLEADVNTMVKGVKVGVNSNTTLPLVTEEDDYGKVVESTHKIYAEAKKLSVLDDVKGNVSLTHTYNKINSGDKLNKVLGAAIKNVAGEAEVNYNKFENLKLNGKVNFKANVADKKIEVKKNDVKLFAEAEALYNHEYNVTATYTGVKDLELVANPFVGHVGVSYKNENNKITRNDAAYYGVFASAKYTGVKNLTLTGKTQLAGVTRVDVDKDVVKGVATDGYFFFDVNAKYDHKVSDKFTVSPEASAKYAFETEDKVVGNTREVKAHNHSLTLTPKVSAEYKPADSLTIKGSVELPVSFGGLGLNKADNGEYSKANASNPENVFGYKSTSFKTSLNVKYTW